MSATINWEPVSKEPGFLNTPAPSHFISMLARVGIAMGDEVGSEHRDVLRGLAASVCETHTNPYQELLDLIDDHSRVRIWATY